MGYLKKSAKMMPATRKRTIPQFLQHCEGDLSATPKNIYVYGQTTYNHLRSTGGPFNSNGYIYASGGTTMYRIDSHTDFNFGTGDFTLECWMRRISDGSDRYLIYRENAFSIRFNPLKVQLGDGGGALSDVITGSGSVGTSWQHVAVVRSGTTLTAYINGVDVGNTTNSYDIDCSDYLYLCARSGNNGYYLHGGMAEIRFSNVARWTSDFSSSLPSAPYESDANTVFLYHGDGYDQKGSSYYIAAGDGYYSHRLMRKDYSSPFAGIEHGGWYFDDSSDYVQLQDSANWNFGTGKFTVDFWFRLWNKSGFQPMMTNSYIPGSGVNNIELYAYRTVDQLTLRTPTTGFTNGITTVPTFAWRHIAIVGDGTNIKVYMGGNLEITTPQYHISGNDGIIFGGCHYNSSYRFNGMITEVRIIKGITSWTAPFTPPTIPYTRMD